MAEASSSSKAFASSPSPIQTPTPIAKHASLSDSPLLSQSGVLGGIHDEDAIGGEDDEEHAWYTAVPEPPLRDTSMHEAHLPTPKTSGQVHTTAFQSFLALSNSSPESPLALAHGRSLGGLSNTSRLHSRCQSTPRRNPEPSQPITPAASPIRRGSRNSSVRSAVLQSPISDELLRVKTESPPLSLGPAPEIVSSRVSCSSQPTPEPLLPLDLSSPFLERPVLIDQISRPVTDRETHDQQVGTEIADVEPDRQMMSVDDTELSTRVAGGELERIRRKMSSLEDARQAELETRRPDYLKRLQKEERLPSFEKNSSDQGLGITETPARGRRLQLFDFQATSAESFEESLMTHGYGTYGEPRTPQKPLGIPEGLSQDALNWLTFHTPAPGHTVQLPPEATSGKPTEKELKKRKRLEAFHSSSARAYAKLYPTELEGYGRVILNVPPEEAAELLGTPSKKRALAKKKRGAPAMEKRIKQEAARQGQDVASTEILWLDTELPWSMREKQREDEIRALEDDRMKTIDNYFSQDTDNDERLESDDEDFPSTWDEFTRAAVEAPRPGRGKTVPLRSDPDAGQTHIEPEVGSPIPQRINFTTDPADARTALLGKRSVRLLVHKRRRKESASREQQDLLGCECGDDSVEKQAVQCDDCLCWYHLTCIGVQDEIELGGKDEPWFCPRCIAQIEAEGAMELMRGQRQPTFTVGEQSPVRREMKSDVSFYSSSSPVRGWGSSSSLHTPLQTISHRKTPSNSRRSLWDESPNASRASRIFTPGTGNGGHARRTSDIDSSSPTLPIPRYPSFGTPKNSAAGVMATTPAFGVPWALNTNALHTPQNNGSQIRYPNIGSTGYGFQVDDSAGIFGHGGALHAYTWRGDENDTPIRRAPPKSIAAGSLQPFIAGQDSPLGQKGQVSRLSGGPRSFAPSQASPLTPVISSYNRN